MSKERVRRSIECEDAMGRRKSLRVLGESGSVFLQTPAGEVARLEPHAITELKSALDDALASVVREQLL